MLHRYNENAGTLCALWREKIWTYYESSKQLGRCTKYFYLTPVYIALFDGTIILRNYYEGQD